MSPLGVSDILRRSQIKSELSSSLNNKTHLCHNYISTTNSEISQEESSLVFPQNHILIPKFLHNIVSQQEHVNNSTIPKDEVNPFLRLMSISCMNEVGLVALNNNSNKNCPSQRPNTIASTSNNTAFLHSDIIASSSSSSISPSTNTTTIIEGKMLLKSEHLPGGSPIPIPSPNSSGSGHPESPKSTAADPGNHGHHNLHRLTPPDDSLFSCTNKLSDSPSSVLLHHQTTNNNNSNPTNAPMNDEDEVLSIGRDDDDDIHRQQILMDCEDRSSPPVLLSSDSTEEDAQKIKTEDCHNNNTKLMMSTSPQRHIASMNGSISEHGGDFMEDDDRLSQNSSEMELGSVGGGCRARKYSSEDSFTIKSLCSPNNYHHNGNSNDTTTTSTASPPPPSTNQQQLNGVNNLHLHHPHQFRHNSPSANTNGSISNGGSNNNNSTPTTASLLFSIANILRPDFGLGTSAANTNPFIPHKNLKSPPITDFNYKHTTHQYAQHHHKSSHGSHNKKQQQSPMLSSNPIDLSRPTSASSHLISHHPHLNNPHHHLSHHHQINQLLHPLNHLQSISTSATKGSSSMSNGNSNININSNGHGAPATNTSSSSSSNKHKSKSHHNHEPISKSSSKSEPKISSRDRDNNSNHSSSSSSSPVKEASSGGGKDGQTLWPAWVYCTRYSDRPSSGPRARRTRKEKEKEVDEKRPRTAFTAEQLARLKKEFEENRYLTEKRRQDLAKELRLHENQIKIWFQNKRAKLKKASGTRGGLALQLMAQGLYNHSTIPRSGDDDSD